jgi:PEP-CTERM motif
MSPLLRSGAAAFAAAAIFALADAARASCVDPNASYQGGAYGAYAVTEYNCSILQQDGGNGFTTASAQGSVVFGADTLSLSSTADLATGALTIDSEAGIASASIWDSFTYTGLPAGGATITATLSFPGTLTGSSYGIAVLEEGSQTEFNDESEFGDSTGKFFNTTSLPPPLSLSFNVVNGSPVVIFAELLGGGASGVADFGDPPMLSLTLPDGASVTTASGVFDNFVSATVPEPSTWAMILVGFAGLGFVGYRQRQEFAGAVSV